MPPGPGAACVAAARPGAAVLSARRLRAAAGAALLAGPFVLAFWSGGGPDRPRLVAAVVVWGIVAVAAATTRPAVPPRALVAAGGLLGLAVLSLLSGAWAPVPSLADDAAQRATLYAGALVAALLVAPRGTERTLLAATTILALYALGDRLLPGVLRYEASAGALGRLEQPITYWNGLGALMALGVVLAAARHRPAVAAPLGLALALTAGRGALFAAAVGLLALAVTRPDRRTIASIGLAVAAAAVPAAVALPMDGVAQRLGDERTLQGAVVLAVLLAVVAVVRRAPLPPSRAIRLPRHAGLVVACVAVAAVPVAAAVGERGSDRGDAARLASLGSNRYDYWDVAVAAAAEHPLAGVGAGGWSAEWLRERPYREGVRDAHSLPLQVAAELGILGLVALLAFVVPVARAARHAAPGVVAGLATLGVHQTLDWDWQLPAVTLPAILLAAAALTATPRPAVPPGGTPATTPGR